MRSSLRVAVAIGVLLAAGIFYLARAGMVPDLSRPPIKVGILHSLSGTMAISEISVANATQLAVDRLNERGGVLGRPVHTILVDGRSDCATFAEQAERLITQEGVSVVFGCWTSASRKTVKPIFERLDHLLIYPVQYEGLEQSPNIVYTGAAPNQQIIPAVKWAFDNLGNRFFLVASDYVFPRAANAIIREQVAALRGTIVGERYLLLGTQDVDETIEEIVRVRPDVILNTINGDTNVAFFRALRRAGITADEIPTMSFSIAEDELRLLGAQAMVGDYAAWNYFQSIEGEENEEFVQRFKARFGADRVTDDPMEAAYFGVSLWAAAVEAAGTEAVSEVRKVIGEQSLAAPEGVVSIDPATHHTWKTVRVGRIRADGQFDIVWTSTHLVRPVPYPVYRTPEAWHQFLDDLYSRWNGSWANPGA